MTKFEPKNLDGLAAATRLRDAGKVTPGWCLQVTWRAFGSPKSDGEQGGYQWATDARKGAQAKGALVAGRLEDAPVGAVLYWSGVMGMWLRDGKRIWGDAGHVAIMTADRRIATIDLPVRGFTGAVTPAEFRRAWGHLKFEGWAIGPGAFLGHNVLGAALEGNAVPPAENLVPATAPQIGALEMAFIRTPDGTIYLGTDDGLTAIADTRHLSLLQAVAKAKPGEILEMSREDLDTVNGYLWNLSEAAIKRVSS